ncbi:MAG: TonB-dependent receptor, partial [Acidobacteria bacterium]|nr:TonB-dependent receptor [Acidobacteriota bacterium]
SPGWTNSQRIANTYQYTDNFTWIKGKHSLKLGGDIRRIQSTLTNPQTQPRGLFHFDGNYSSNLGAGGTGSPWASFLLGYPYRVERDFVDTRPGVRMLYWGFYLQDDYRITSKLTLNVGLRWDLFTRPVEKYNRQSNFDLGDGLIHVASSSDRGPNVDNFTRGFGPRVGLAYSPDNGKTAIRAAYGISYFPDNFGATGGTLERNYPFFLLNVLQQPNQFVPTRSVSDGLPGFTPVPLAPTLNPPPGFAVWFIARNFRQDMAQMWNFSVQRQLGWKTMVEAAYLGTRGTHIYRDRDINVPLPAPGSFDERRPYYSLAPNVTEIHQRNGDGDSYYNALQVKVEKRFSDGFQMLTAYTFSKSIDTVSSPLFPYFDSLNRGLSAGFKAVDIPQNLVMSYSYELPMGTGKPYLSGGSALARKVLGGWSINGITTVQSGQPLVMSVATSRLNTGTGNRPDITCTSVGTPKRVDAWLDTGCFADPAPYTFGNSGIGHVRGPGLVNFDFSVFKKTAIDERRSIEFRAEFFNLFNNPHFANPNTTYGSGSFGRISGTVLTPREIQMGLRFAF